MTGMVRDAPGGLGQVGRPIYRSGKGWGMHPEVRDGSGDLLEVRDG